MSLIPDDYFDRLKKKYESDPNLADYWAAEEKPLRWLTEEVCKHIAFSLPAELAALPPNPSRTCFSSLD
jgi:hypothetical protein